MRPPPGQSPAIARNSKRSLASSPTTRTRSPGFNSTWVSLSETQPDGAAIREVVNHDRLVFPLIQLNPILVLAEFVIVKSVFRKLATRSSVARQSATLEKLSTYHRSACCTWLKAPTTIMRLGLSAHCLSAACPHLRAPGAPKGGALAEIDLALPRSRPATIRTDEDTITLVRRLAALYPDAVIAGILIEGAPRRMAIASRRATSQVSVGTGISPASSRE